MLCVKAGFGRSLEAGQVLPVESIVSPKGPKTGRDYVSTEKDGSLAPDFLDPQTENAGLVCPAFPRKGEKLITKLVTLANARWVPCFGP